MSTVVVLFPSRVGARWREVIAPWHATLATPVYKHFDYGPRICFRAPPLFPAQLHRPTCHGNDELIWSE